MRVVVILAIAALLCVGAWAQDEGAEGQQQQQQQRAAANHIFVPEGRTVITAINAGGDEYTGIDGTEYKADTDFQSKEPSEPITTEGGLVGQDADVYSSARKGAHFAYSVTLPKKGSYYTLVLKFAEIAEEAGVGVNVFDVAVNGQILIPNFDLFQVTGPNTPYDIPLQFFYTGSKLRFSEKLMLPVQQGHVVVELIGRKGEAKINGVVLFRGLLQQQKEEEKAEEKKAAEKDLSFIQQNGPFIGVVAVLAAGAAMVLYFINNAPKKMTKAERNRKIGVTVKRATSPKKE
jgi:hypothetical protein